MTLALTPILIALAVMGALGLAFALLIALANYKLKVPEDPQVCALIGLLPAANCGSCGFAGCANFAENLVAGKAMLSACPVCSKENRAEIVKLLGTVAENQKRKVAVILCRADDAGTKKALYQGVQTCLGASLVSGGARSCNYGCIGLADCIKVCAFDALKMGPQGLPIVDRQKCTACNRCVEVCPRRIIELHPIDRHVFVLCKNLEKGRAAKDSCAHACIGCGLCVKAVGGAGMQLVNNLLEIDYEHYTKDITKDIEIAIEKCPMHVIQKIGSEDEE